MSYQSIKNKAHGLKNEPPNTHVIDREAVRLLALQVGVREAARRCGLNEKRVLAWSYRFGWLKQTSLPPTHNDQKAVVVSAVKPGDVFLEELKACNGETRLALSRATHKGAEQLAKSPPPAIVDAHAALRSLTASAAQIHKWNERETTVANQVNVVIGQEVIDDLRSRLERARKLV